jgi:cysteine synthase A
LSDYLPEVQSFRDADRLVEALRGRGLGFADAARSIAAWSPPLSQGDRYTARMSIPRESHSLSAAIGNTPVVQLRRLPRPGSAAVFVKLEYCNPTGSYKDRMALAMVEGAEARGALTPGMRVIEFTGGSTGSSLAMVCAAKGYRCMLLSSDAFAREKIQTMEAFGAEVEMIASDGGAVTPALFARFRERIATLKDEPGTWWADQFHNVDALTGYQDIGRELLDQIGTIDAFCGAVGTAGMLVGVSRALKAGGSAARIVALEPATSPALTAGHGGPHRVEGIATAQCRRISPLPITTRRVPWTRKKPVASRGGWRAKKASSLAHRQV